MISRRNTTGFSLVELMIVVAIIGILAAIAIPNFVAMQLKAKRSEVPSNVDGIKTAEVAYEAAFDAYLDSAAKPGSIYLSSMSVLLIACCYWKRANNWGAIGGIFLGAAVPISHLTLEKLPSTAAWAASIGKDLAGIAAFAAAALGMIVGSLLKPRAS